MKDSDDFGFTAFVGIDWADRKHDVCVKNVELETINHSIISSAPEALSKWISDLRKEIPNGKIAICLEQSKGPLIFQLMMHDFITLFPINPRALARFREALSVSGAKSDEGDAFYLQEFVSTYHKRLDPWVADDEKTRSINSMTYSRRKAVNECTRIANRLKACLKMYYPQALEFTGDSLKNNMALEFLEKWPQLTSLKRARIGTIAKFYHLHGVRSEKLINSRLELYKNSVPLTNDKAVIESCMISVKMMVAQIRVLNASIKEFDETFFV